MKTTSGYIFQRKKNENGKPCGSYYLMYVINGKKKLVSLKTENLTDAKKARDEYLTPALKATTTEKVTRHIAETRDLLTDIKFPLSIVWGQYFKNPRRPQKTSPGTLGNYERNWLAFKSWLEKNHSNIERINQITEREAEAYAEHLWEKSDIKPVKKLKGSDPAKPDHKPNKAERKLLRAKQAKENKLKRGITANTHNYHIQSLNLIFKTLFDTDKTPFSGIEKKLEEKMTRKDFTGEEVTRIYASFDDPALCIPDKKEMRLLIHILSRTGLRLVDAVNIKWEQIDFARKTITAMPVKTRGIQRLVHIPFLDVNLKALLDIADSKDKSEYVLPRMVERYERNSDGIIDDFYKILDLESVGLNKVNQATRGMNRKFYSFHSFRHTLCSSAANAGVPITTLASILGDNVRTLEKYYIKVNDQSKIKAILSLPY